MIVWASSAAEVTLIVSERSRVPRAVVRYESKADSFPSVPSGRWVGGDDVVVCVTAYRRVTVSTDRVCPFNILISALLPQSQSVPCIIISSNIIDIFPCAMRNPSSFVDLFRNVGDHRLTVSRSAVLLCLRNRAPSLYSCSILVIQARSVPVSVLDRWV